LQCGTARSHRTRPSCTATTWLMRCHFALRRAGAAVNLGIKSIQLLL
jgi:hypothetical protein